MLVYICIYALYGSSDLISLGYHIWDYCILCGRIKGFNSSITTIMCQVGSYRTVVG